MQECSADLHLSRTLEDWTGHWTGQNSPPVGYLLYSTGWTRLYFLHLAPKKTGKDGASIIIIIPFHDFFMPIWWFHCSIPWFFGPSCGIMIIPRPLVRDLCEALKHLHVLWRRFFLQGAEFPWTSTEWLWFFGNSFEVVAWSFVEPLQKGWVREPRLKVTGSTQAAAQLPAALDLRNDRSFTVMWNLKTCWWPGPQLTGVES